MKIAFGRAALLFGLLFGVLASACAAEYDPNTQALESLRLTLEKHSALPQGTPDPQGVKRHAQFLMLIKNAMSLYRDDYLTHGDAERLSRFLSAHVGYTNAALAAAENWPLRQKSFLRTMHHHALAVNQLVSMPKDSPTFAGLMSAYHSGIGYDAYRAAQDIGIEQRWEEAP